jgi:hypothetical protein
MLIFLADETFPDVWMAPPAVRDLRGVVRTGEAILEQGSGMKNWVHGVWNQYGLQKRARERLPLCSGAPATDVGGGDRRVVATLLSFGASTA